MKILLSLAALLWTQSGLMAQSFIEKDLATSITEVTVFIKGAQVVRTGKIELSAGNTILILRDLSSFIDPKSIQVKGTGDFTLLSVNHQLNYLEKSASSEQDEKLKEELKRIESQALEAEASLKVLDEQKELLRANKSIGSDAQGVTLSELKLIAAYFYDELSKISAKELALRRNIRVLEERKKELDLQLQELNSKEDLPTGEIQIRVKSSRSVKAELTITYLTDNCGWFPKYDLRASNIDEPISLLYKADVYQNTGKDWKNVKLTLSNVDPRQSGMAPELDPWQLNYARYTSIRNAASSLYSDNVRDVRGIVTDAQDGSPLPGANIIIKGTTIGTITDVNGRYSIAIPNNANTLQISFVGYMMQEVPINSAVINISMQPDVMALQEVVVTGYGIQGKASGVSGSERREKPQAAPVQTTITQTQTTVELTLDIPYTVLSNGETYSVDLESISIPALYEYYAVPKFDPDAFLIAKITGWNNYNLLQGEANLYFEGTYIGRTILDVNNFSDTLEVSMGRDKNVLIKREKDKQYSKSRAIGSNKVDTRAFRITVRNNKAKPVNLTIWDQVPVPVISTISVEPINLKDGILDKDTGAIRWNTTITPNGQQEFTFGYEVKYPKNESVILE